jgi:KaiC/GvpD/RAD55 family RecA-like ATPase
MSEVIGREQCPKCNDNAGDNLILYDNGGKHCFACNYHVSGTSDESYESEQQIGGEQMENYTTETILAKRGVIPEVIKSYGVTSMETSYGELMIAFPVPDANGKFVSSHYRKVDLTTGKLTREMLYPKGTKITNPLFGWHMVKRYTKYILVCEGETDALAAASKLHGRKDVAVVGLLGTGFAKRAAAQLVTYAGNRKVILAFDNDEAGSGALDVIRDYCESKSEVQLLRLPFPSEYKDVSEWLAKDSDVHLYQMVTEECVHLASICLVNGRELGDRLENYIVKLREHSFIELKFSPTLNNALRLVPGTLLGVLGDGGQGKSTMCEQIALEAAAQGKYVLYISAEMKPEEVALKLARSATGINYYSREVAESITDEELHRLNKLTEKLTQKIYIHDSAYDISPEGIEKQIVILDSLGVHPELVVVDHIIAISPDSEVSTLMKTAQYLKQKVAERHDTCVICMSHIRKPQQGAGKVYKPKLSDEYNSGALAKWADTVLGVATDKQKFITYVETVKLSRMGASYVDVPLKLVDWQLCELSEDETVGERMDAEDNIDLQEVY